jgi:hypothetical protein
MFSATASQPDQHDTRGTTSGRSAARLRRRCRHQAGAVVAVDVFETLRVGREYRDLVPETQLHGIPERRHVMHERAEDGEVRRMVLCP